MKFGKHPGEKLTRFSIRKYHFGAASVAVASLLFFGANSVKAEEALVARQDGVASSSNPNSGEGDPDQATLKKPEGSVYQAPEAGTNATIGSTTTPVGGATKINDEGTSNPQLDKKSLPTEIAKSQVDKSELSSVVNQVSATISSLQSSSLAENVKTALAQVESAVANAKQVLANPDASKADVEQALSSLQQAVSSLEAAKRPEVAPKPAQPEQPAEGNSGEETSLPKKRGKKSAPVANPIADGKEETATLEVANPAPATLEPVTPAKRRRGRTTDVQPESAGGSNPEAEVAPKAIPTYTNGKDNYALAEEMRNIVTYLRKNGADESEVAAIKDNYDKLNEKLGLADENAVLSEADFATATANLKAARDFTEGFLRKQDENGQPLNEQPTVPGTERSVEDEPRRRSRAIGQDRDGTNHYNVAKEYYYEDGTKGSSPYDKYTYLFHTFTESLVANNANHSPVRDIKRLVYEEVTEVDGGYLWNITFNAAHEDQQDGYAFFSIPKGQRVENNSISIIKTAQNGNEDELSGSGDLLNRLKSINPNSSLTGREIGIRRNGGAEEDSLEGLARSSAYAGYYTRRLESANGETIKSDDMFNRIADNTQSVYSFRLHGRDSYTISFKTTNTNNTKMDKLYYASGYRVQQWGRRILAEQWHGRHAYDKDDTDRFPLHVVGNGTFLIKQGKHYNTAYPQGAYGFGGRDFDYAPRRADGILGYDATGAYNSNFDMHQYTAPVGSDTPSSNTKATTAGQQFEFYDKEGNKLSASQIGMHGADKPGLVEYKVKRTFKDGSADFLNIKFAIQPKTPTFTENIANSRGQTKNLTVSNGTNGYPITLFREYVENGVTKTEKVATVNANGGGNAVFNNVLIKGGKYYAQSIIPTSAYFDYSNQKHTDVRSDKSTLQEVRADGMAPTIQVGENGKPLATTPANNQVTLFVTPSADGKVSLNVQVQDDALGDGMNELSTANNGNVRFNIAGAYNNRTTTFTKNGGVTGANGKKDTIKGDLKIQLNQDGGKYKIPNGGLTVTLNATDKAGNKTESATPAKTLTVKVLSAVPNEPPVRMLTGNDVQNGAIKTDVKNQVLQNVKNANPDLVNAGVKFEYDTTAGRTNQIKVTYPDGQTATIDPMKGTKPTKPVVVGPQDGTVSITPQGDTDKVTFSYVPTGQTAAQQVIAKKDGNSWAIQGTRPNGITVDSSTGKITITEPTVKDQSNVTATATFLNSDNSDRGEDTAKNPDREAPTVSIKTGDGTVRQLSANAAENKFLVYRGATFNPTFIVNDNSGTTDNFMIKNVPNGVWFNKQGGRDVAHTDVANGREITFSNQIVDPNTPLGTREATVSVRDKNGNAAEYKFQYIIADVLVKNSPKSVATGSKLGDSHQFVASTLNGTTSNDDVYFPGSMKFLWANNENSNTTLPNSAQTVTKEAIVEFPDTALNGRTAANGITIYAPKQIKKNVTFNLADNEKPQATLNGISIGQTAGEPIFTVFRGANFNPQLEAWDNSGKITNVTISGLPTSVTATAFPGGEQRGSESSKYNARLSSGVVPDEQALGEYEATLTVRGDGNNDTSVLKFKYRVVDMDFKNGYETDDAGQRTGKSYVIGLKNGQSVNLRNGDKNIDPKDYWKVIDDANKTDRGYAYLPEGVSYSISGGAISSNPADKSKGASVAMGHYGRRVYVDFTSAGDIANDNSTSRTVFTPRTIDRRVLVAVDPTAPTIDGGEDLLYGKAGERPDIKVKEIVNIGESDADVGTVNKNAIRTIQLYSDRDPNTPIAEHAFAKYSRETEYTFRGSDYATSRPNGLLADETIYSRVKVTHYGVSTLSGNSNEKEVTAKLDVRENATNRIIQANDQKLNDAEKTGIRIALRNANPTLNLSDENIEISDSGAIVITKDKKRAWLQTNPNKKEGNTTTGFVTRFANIRNDYKFENIEGLKVPGRDTDKGFAWSNSTSDNRVNGDRSLVYYYDATKGQAFNFNDVLKVLNLREGWTVNHTENPSFVATQGVNKEKAEHRQDGFSMSGTAFLKDGNYINVIDLVDRGSLSGGQNVSNSANKLVQQGKGGGTDTNLQNVTIAAANGLPGFTLNNVVNGEQAIHKAQVYLRPKYVNAASLAERNGETKDTTTNVVNLYFVPIDPVKPVVEPSDSNELGTSADNAPRLTDASITASSLVKVTDNYDRDDLGTGATTTSSTGTAAPTTGTTLANEVRKRLNVWVKKDGVKTQVVENGVEKTTTNGETVLGSLIKTADPATYELLAQASDTSGNRSEEESLGFFKVGYNLVARPLINFLQNEQLSDDDKRTLVQVNEGGQLGELPNGATLDVTFDTSEATKTGSTNTPKTATARVTLPNGATKEIPIVYNVSKTFPMVSKVYDFSGVSRTPGDSLTRYIESTNLPWGMNWTLDKETENENHVKSWERQSNAINQAINDDIHKRQTSAQTSPYAPGEYKYRLSARYPDGRYLNSGNGVTVPELTKLLREGEIVHTVFDVGENATKVETNYGSALTDEQARNAVTTINGSKDLPDGTTYEWVNQNGSALTNKTVSEFGDDDGYVTRYVKVTLPKTQEAGPDAPAASQEQPSKIVPVKVKVNETVKPTVSIKDGSALSTNASNEAAKFVVFRGATFNPTFTVNDNSGKVKYLKVSGLPSGNDFEKTTETANGNVQISGNSVTVPENATLGTDFIGKVLVRDRAGNEQEYQFKYAVVDAKVINSPKTVESGTNLVVGNHATGTIDSHAYIKVVSSDAADANGNDDFYPPNMRFKWGTKPEGSNAVRELTETTTFNDPGVVTDYYAIARTELGQPGLYSKGNVKIYFPEKIALPVTFNVKPKAPVVTPKQNGDVVISHENQTNVNRINVTYTPQEGTNPAEVTYTATKNGDTWSVDADAPLTVNPTTGEITLKEKAVKDGSTVKVKALTKEDKGSIESSEANGNAVTYAPTPKEQVVNINEEASAANAIANPTDLPQTPTFTWKQGAKPDTSSAGVKTGTVVVRFPDQTEREVKATVIVKEEKPAAPEISQWQNGNVKVTPAETNSGDKVTVPLRNGNVVLSKNDTGWAITNDVPDGVVVRDNKLEIPRNLVNENVTATSTKGEGQVASESDAATHTLLAHTVKLTDVVKKADSTLKNADLSWEAGVVGVTDGDVTKEFKRAKILTVVEKSTLPTIENNHVYEVPVTITYADGSTEDAQVTVKVKPATPEVAPKEDGTVDVTPNLTGEGTATITYTAEDGASKTVTLTKAADGTWSSSDQEVPVDAATGKVTLKAAQVKDRSIVSAQTSSALTNLTSEKDLGVAGSLDVLKANAKDAIEEAAKAEKAEIEKDGSLTKDEKATKVARVDAVKDEEKAKVEAATDAAGVQSAQTTGVETVRAVHTPGTLDEAKRAAKAALDAAADKEKAEIRKDTSLTSKEIEDKIAEVDRVKEAEQAKVDAVKTIEVVDVVKRTGETAIAEVHTPGNLEAAKEKAKSQLEAIAAVEKSKIENDGTLTSEERTTQLQKLQDEVTKQKGLIDAANTAETLATTKEAADAAVKAVHQPGNLEAAKTAAKAALEDAATAEKEAIKADNSLTETEKQTKAAEVDKVKAAEQAKVDAAKTIEVVEVAKETGKTAIAEVHTLGNLDTAKAKAKAALDEAAATEKAAIEADGSLSSADKATKLAKVDEVKEAEQAKIDQATTATGVEEAKTAGATAIGEVHTPGTLDAAKEAANNAIDAAAAAETEEITNDSSLSEEQKAAKKAEVEKAKEDAKAKIKAATNKDIIDTATETGKNVIGKVHENGNLDTAKAKAKAALDEAAATEKAAIEADGSLSTTEKAEKAKEVDKVKAEKAAKIDEATTATGVEEAKTAGEAAIAAVHQAGDLEQAKTDAKAAIDEAAAAEKAEIAKDTSLSEDQKAAKTAEVTKAQEDAKAKIAAATNKDIIDTVKATADKVIKAVHTNGSLDDVKAKAKAELEDAAEAEKDEIRKDSSLTETEKAEKLKEVDKATEAAKAKVDEANNATEVDTAKNDGADTIGKVHDNGSLDKVKEAAKQAIDQAAEREKEEINNDGSLTQPEKEAKLAELEKAKQAAKDKVEAAKDADAVEKAKTAGEKAVDRVHNNGDLDKVKQNAKDALDEAAEAEKDEIRKDPSLTETEKAEKLKEVDKATEAAKAKVDEASNADAVAKAQKDGEKAIDDVHKLGEVKHEIPNNAPSVEVPEYTGTIGSTGVDGNGNLITPPVVEIPEYTGTIGASNVDENGHIISTPVVDKPALIITKWIDEQGNELKSADAKAPTVLGGANEAFEHGEIEGYVFVRTETEGDVVTHVFRKVSPVRPTGDGQQRPATPSDDTNRRLDTATPAEVPAAQPTEQPSQTVEVPSQLADKVETVDAQVAPSQNQAVLPNTGTKADRATGALGALSLLGAFGLLFAKKKKDDEEEA